MKKEVTCTVEKRIAVISTNAKGFSKEVNLVSWNGENAKLDIREWKPDGTALKGNTYTQEEAMHMLECAKSDPCYIPILLASIMV